MARPAAIREHRVEEDVEAALLTRQRRVLDQHSRVAEPRRLDADLGGRKVALCARDKGRPIGQFGAFLANALPKELVLAETAHGR